MCSCGFTGITIIPLLPGMLVSTRGTGRVEGVCKKSLGSCEWRTKNNATKVYVYPTAGPKIYYEANGRKKNSITGQYEKFAGSYSYAIPTGTQGSITNWINEKGGTEARLVMSRISYSRLDTSGVWSPDSTRNYTIFG